MHVDDAMRLGIHRKLEEPMGAEEAEYMVTNWLPWHDLATKDDLRVISAELRGDIRAELHEAIATQTRWLVGFVAVWSGLMLAAARLMF